MNRSRFDYVKYDAQSQGAQEAAKFSVTEVELLIDGLGKGRAQSVAMTKLEECYMWIGKAIRDTQKVRNPETELQEERKDG